VGCGGLAARTGMNMKIMNVPKRFKAMCALILLHGSLIVIDNLQHMLQGGFYISAMLIVLLAIAISLLLCYLVLTRRLWVILGVSLLFACLLSLGVQQFTNHWPPINFLVFLQDPFRTLPNIIYLLEAIIPLFGIVILFLGIRTSSRASRA
jgi:type IV secretory pathway VirB2 component (pilin)